MPVAPTHPMARAITRWLLAAAYLVAGYFHLAAPGPFLGITPDWVPFAPQVIYWTGLAEIAGALALVQPSGRLLRKAAGIGLAAYALCVWPANFNHFLIEQAQPDGGLGLGYHLPRLAFQPVIIWASLWAAGVTNWPFTRRPA